MNKLARPADELRDFSKGGIAAFMISTSDKPNGLALPADAERKPLAEMLASNKSEIPKQLQPFAKKDVEQKSMPQMTAQQPKTNAPSTYRRSSPAARNNGPTLG